MATILNARGVCRGRLRQRMMWKYYIFRPCKSLKSRVIACLWPQKNTEKQESKSREVPTDAKEKNERGTAEGRSDGGQKASKKDQNPKEASAGFLSWYINNSDAENSRLDSFTFTFKTRHIKNSTERSSLLDPVGRKNSKFTKLTSEDGEPGLEKVSEASAILGTLCFPFCYTRIPLRSKIVPSELDSSFAPAVSSFFSTQIATALRSGQKVLNRATWFKLRGSRNGDNLKNENHEFSGVLQSYLIFDSALQRIISIIQHIIIFYLKTKSSNSNTISNTFYMYRFWRLALLGSTFLLVRVQI